MLPTGSAHDVANLHRSDAKHGPEGFACASRCVHGAYLQYTAGVKLLSAVPPSGSHGFANGPSAFKARLERRILSASDAAPVGHSVSLASVFDEVLVGARAAVVGLLKRRGPSAVFGRVGAVVVDAIQRMSLGLVAHVGVKSREIGVPAVANVDSATAPVGVSRMVRIVAAGLHVAPRVVSRSRLSSWFLAVLGRAQARYFSRNAPAAFRDTVFQRKGTHRTFGAAFAPAKPVWLVGMWRPSKNGPASEYVPNEV